MNVHRTSHELYVDDEEPWTIPDLGDSPTYYTDESSKPTVAFLVLLCALGVLAVLVWATR